MNMMHALEGHGREHRGVRSPANGPAKAMLRNTIPPSSPCSDRDMEKEAASGSSDAGTAPASIYISTLAEKRK